MHFLGFSDYTLAFEDKLIPSPLLWGQGGVSITTLSLLPKGFAWLTRESPSKFRKNLFHLPPLHISPTASSYPECHMPELFGVY